MLYLHKLLLSFFIIPSFLSAMHEKSNSFICQEDILSTLSPIYKNFPNKISNFFIDKTPYYDLEGCVSALKRECKSINVSIIDNSPTPPFISIIAKPHTHKNNVSEVIKILRKEYKRNNSLFKHSLKEELGVQEIDIQNLKLEEERIKEISKKDVLLKQLFIAEKEITEALKVHSENITSVSAATTLHQEYLTQEKIKEDLKGQQARFISEQELVNEEKNWNIYIPTLDKCPNTQRVYIYLAKKNK